MREELLATYYYYDIADGDNTVFEIVAYYDSIEDYDTRTVSYYDVFDKAGNCMNEGEPLTAMPTWDFVRSYFHQGV